jgi:hypothetical protein
MTPDPRTVIFLMVLMNRICDYDLQKDKAWMENVRNETNGDKKYTLKIIII